MNRLPPDVRSIPFARNNGSSRSEFATRRREIEEAVGREAAGKVEELAAAQRDLADLRKQLDDRDQTRARRDLQESLSKSLACYTFVPAPLT